MCIMMVCFVQPLKGTKPPIIGVKNIRPTSNLVWTNQIIGAILYKNFYYNSLKEQIKNPLI